MHFKALDGKVIDGICHPFDIRECTSLLEKVLNDISHFLLVQPDILLFLILRGPCTGPDQMVGQEFPRFIVKTCIYYFIPSQSTVIFW